MRPIAVGLSALALVITASAGVLLWTNNQSWAAAGREVNAIRGALNDLYRKIPGDPQVLFIGLPDHIHGAYACRNALWGMTKYPQLHRDIQNCQMVNGYDPIFPFGFLKDSLSGSRDQVLMFRWGGIARGFIPINFGSVEGSASTASAPAPLTTRLEPVPRPGSTYLRRADGTIEVRGGSGFRGRPELNFNLDRTSCWSVDFIAVDIVVPEPATLNPRCGADILYSNELVKDFELSHRSHADILPGLKEQRLIFPFRSSTDWSFGGRCRGLKLLLPDATHLIVKAVSVMPRSEIMPAIDFKNSGYLGTKGYIHLSAHEPFQDLAIDVRSIARARGAILEITRPNLLFESQNSQLASSVVMKSLQLRGRQGTLRLERNIFPAAVMYEIRAWAIDDGGRKIGVAGDHLVVSVDP